MNIYTYICQFWCRLHMCNMTSSQVWHNSFMCDMTHSCMLHGSFICVTWLHRIRDVTSTSHTVHMWMSHGTHMIESCHTYGWVMSHIRMSHVTLIDESCHTYKWVMWHIWTNTYECMTWLARLTQYKCEWDMSHTWLSRVIHIDESRDKYERTHMNQQIWMHDVLACHILKDHYYCFAQ